MSSYATAWTCSRLGWRVFPIKPETKRPAVRKWPTEATTDLDQIARWWGWVTDFPRFVPSVGILTGPESGIWVLDIDVKWCNGFEALRDLFHGHGVTEIPRTFRVKTPSGGQQWYFRYPDDGRKIGNIGSSPHRPGPLGPGLEVRGWHGQVVAPGTSDRTVLCDVPPTDAPEWLVDLVTARRHNTAEIPEWASDAGHVLRIAERAAETLAALAPNTGRNSELNRQAFALGLFGRSGGITRDTAHGLLRRACEENGLVAEDGEASFEATFNSGWNAGITAGEHR